MTSAVARPFEAKVRDRLIKLFRALGSDNTHEADAVRSHIDSLLPQFGKSWIDLVELLSNGATVSLPPSLAANIIGLSDPDPARRAAARQGIMELLARRRMTWNDLTDLLIGITSA